MTPCIKECRIKNGFCSGCKRTLKEITEWKDKVVDDRMALMNQIKGQTSTHNCPSCNSAAYCAMEDGKSGNLCWCMSVHKDTNLVMDAGAGQCLCRQCLMNGEKA